MLVNAGRSLASIIMTLEWPTYIHDHYANLQNVFKSDAQIDNVCFSDWGSF